MRPPAPLILLLALLALATPATAADGGVRAPEADGGVAYGQPVLAPLKVARFRVSPAVLRADGAPARITYRLTGSRGPVRVWLEVVRSGGGRRPVLRVPLGTHRGGTVSWAPQPGQLTAGRYLARVRVVARRGARASAASARSRLRVLPPRPAPAPPPAPPPTPTPAPPAPTPPAPSGVPGVFPVQGPYTFGGEGARFGASRGTYAHRGQDIAAADGTPVVAPVPGVIFWRAYQATGAGHYLVLRGDDGRDHVFMHLRDGSVVVTKGTRVAAGARLGEVGDTGSSHGPHLHFEIWPDGWFSGPSSAPIDPLPDLLAWAS